MGSHEVLGSMSKNLNGQNGINGDRFELHISQNVAKYYQQVMWQFPASYLLVLEDGAIQRRSQ